MIWMPQAAKFVPGWNCSNFRHITLIPSWNKSSASLT